MRKTNKRSRHYTYYADSYVGEEILRKVDSMTDENTEYKWSYKDAYIDIYRKNPRGINIYTEARNAIVDEYERLGIDFISSKEELYDKFKSQAKDFWNTHDINQYWEEYRQRDKLIRAGLYEKARQELYTEHYMATAAQYMGSKEGFEVITQNLGKLTPQQFVSLTKPSPDRDRTTTALPSIAELYLLKSMKAGTAEYEDLVHRFKVAFKEAGLPWTDIKHKQPKETIIDRSHVTVREFITDLRQQQLNDKYARAFRSQFYFSTTADKEKIIEKGYDLSNTFSTRQAVLEILHERELRLDKQDKSLIKVNKQGGYYIRGVSRAVTADYIAMYHGK